MWQVISRLLAFFIRLHSSCAFHSVCCTTCFLSKILFQLHFCSKRRFPFVVLAKLSKCRHKTMQIYMTFKLVKLKYLSGFALLFFFIFLLGPCTGDINFLLLADNKPPFVCEAEISNAQETYFAQGGSKMATKRSNAELFSR